MLHRRLFKQGKSLMTFSVQKIAVNNVFSFCLYFFTNFLPYVIFGNSIHIRHIWEIIRYWILPNTLNQLFILTHCYRKIKDHMKHVIQKQKILLARNFMLTVQWRDWSLWFRTESALCRQCHITFMKQYYLWLILFRRDETETGRDCCVWIDLY